LKIPFKKSKYHSVMSAGKQPIYATKIRGASGMAKALAIGGGLPSDPGPLVKHCNYQTASGATTLTAANCFGVLAIDPAGGAIDLTMATVSVVAAAFPEWESGCSIDLWVVNTADAAETITMVIGTGFTLVGLATMAQNVQAHWKLIRTGSTTANLVRAS
jgi:hypothetical protein